MQRLYANVLSGCVSWCKNGLGKAEIWVAKVARPVSNPLLVRKENLWLEKCGESFSENN